MQPLNAVLQEFKSWKQPTLMLVGNHDQARLQHAVAHLHAALALLSRVPQPRLPDRGLSAAPCSVIHPAEADLQCCNPRPCGNQTTQPVCDPATLQVSAGGLAHSLSPIAAACPAVHIFEQPTIFQDALWLPYRRDHAELQAALHSAGPIKAVFAHADVVGAALCVCCTALCLA